MLLKIALVVLAFFALVTAHEEGHDEENGIDIKRMGNKLCNLKLCVYI